MENSGIAIVLIAAITIITLSRWLRPSARSQATHTYARRVDLALRPRDEPVVAARLRRRETVGVLSGAAAALASLALLTTDGPTGHVATYGPLLVVLAFFLGHALGVGAVAWYETTLPEPERATRVARTTTPTHDDYVAPIERRGSWVAAVASAVVTLTLVVLDAVGTVDLGPMPWALVGLAVVGPAVAIALDEVVAARLLRRRQVARTALQLAWDDALRSRALRDMTTVVIMVAVYPLLLLLGALSDQLDGGWPANPAVGLLAGLFGAWIVAATLTMVVAAVSAPHRHFRRRLWADDDRVGPSTAGGGSR